MSRRRGKFTITKRAIEDNQEWLGKVYAMAGVIIKADYLAYMDAIEYYSECEDFRQLSEGEAVPSYIINTVTSLPSGDTVNMYWEER